VVDFSPRFSQKRRCAKSPLSGTTLASDTRPVSEQRESVIAMSGRNATRLACALCATLAVANVSDDRTQAPLRPNILLILADDFGWNNLGVSGGYELVAVTHTRILSRVLREGTKLRKIKLKHALSHASPRAVLLGSSPSIPTVSIFFFTRAAPPPRKRRRPAGARRGNLHAGPRRARGRRRATHAALRL